MVPQITCPACQSKLKEMSIRHVNSKKHQDALKNASIKKSDDPALKLIKKTEKPKEKKAKAPSTGESKSSAPKKPAPPKVPKPTKKKAPPKKLKKIKLEPLTFSVEAPKFELKGEEGEGYEYSSEEDKDLGIPIIPEPKKKKKIALESSGLSIDVLDHMKDMDTKDVKIVLIKCDRCKDVIGIPVPRNLILESDLLVTPVSYVHYNKENKDQHCITVYLDHDFDMRRKRLSDVIISK